MRKSSAEMRLSMKQLSVFMENRQGRLEQVTEILMQNKIDIKSFSLADTTEFGMLRLIVSNPAGAKEVLTKEGFSAVLTDVVAVRLQNQAGTLYQLLKVLDQLNIEYMYTLSTTSDSSMVLKTSDTETAIRVLTEAGYDLLEDSSL